ncbi:MAG: hypothetical protein LBH91_05470 [Prevotellaceae bacterium]|jgi:hypothetical protein|nr:hypothetical protein [Prevotellaceae bacterium]
MREYKHKVVKGAGTSEKIQLGRKEPLELINELYTKIEEMGEYDFDEKLVKEYLAVLQEKTPLDMGDDDDVE